MAQIVGDIAISVGADISPLVRELGKASKATDGLGAKAGGLGKSMSFTGNSARMLSQQLSQVGQQTMATGHFVQALAIQLPDIGLAFGTVGTAVGLLAGIALPTLISALTGTGKSTKELEAQLSAMAAAVDAHSRALKEAATPVSELAETYGTLTHEVKQALAALVDVSQAKAIAEVAASIDTVVATLLQAQEVLSSTDGVSDTIESIVTLRDQFDMTVDQAIALRYALIDLSKADGLNDQAKAAAAVQSALLGAYGAADKMPVPLREAYERMAKIVIAAGEVKTNTEHGARLVKYLGEVLKDATKSADGLAAKAAKIAGNFKAAADRAVEMQQAWGAATAPGAAVRGLDDERGSQGDIRADAARNNSDRILGVGYYKPTKNGGGGAGAETGLEERLARMREEFGTETEQLQMQYEERLAQIAEFRDAKLIQEGEYNVLERAAKEEHEEALAKIERDKRAARLSAIAGAFGDLSSLMQSSNKKLFKIGQAAAIAEATVSGYQAAVDAWQKGMKIGGPGMAAAFTAASLAKTGMLIASIKSQSPSGSGGGTSSGGGGANTDAAPSGGTYYNVSLVGGSSYGPDQIRGLISDINKEIEAGAVIKGIRAT